VNAILSGADDAKDRKRNRSSETLPTGSSRSPRNRPPHWAASQAASAATISASSQSRSVTPTAIAGVTVSVRWGADEIAIQEMRCHRAGVVVNLFAEGVRQSRHAALVHPHIEVISLSIGRADVIRIRWPTTPKCLR
jgi:hypothetical protein